MQHTVGMEPGKLVESNLLGGVLPTEDAAALPAMVATLEEAKGFLARGRRAYWSGAVRLNGWVSTTGLERVQAKTHIKDRG
jgi:hypothetical protein